MKERKYLVELGEGIATLSALQPAHNKNNIQPDSYSPYEYSISSEL